MKLYVDDLRPAPDTTWHVARTVQHAIAYLSSGLVKEVSLDHDMGACQDCTDADLHVGDMETPETTFYNYCEHAQNGYDLVMWMIENNVWPEVIIIHTANPVGRRRMQQALESALGIDNS